MLLPMFYINFEKKYIAILIGIEVVKRLYLLTGKPRQVVILAYQYQIKSNIGVLMA